MLALVLAAAPGQAQSSAPASASASAPAPPTPSPCLGAAARDPLRPCRDPALRLRVDPLPSDAVIEPNAPCAVVREPASIESCVFGAAPQQAVRQVALLGDSHAAHWRAALVEAARRRGWHGVSLTRDSCPFTLAVPAVSPASRRRCAAWNRGVRRWLERHPDVDTVFVSAHSGARIVRTGGRRALATKVAGHRAAWASLPTTVRRIVVLRDTPAHPARTADCVTRAAARRQDAGTVCAVPRRTLVPDPQAVAARALPDDRVRVVDVTPVLCDTRACFPVVGGVLVNRDTDHLTRRFATTLAPFVLRVTDAVIRR